jgi:hypothetical protein
VEKKGAQVTAYESGWEVRLKRGGHVQFIEEKFIEEWDWIQKFRWVVLCVGGNDLANKKLGYKGIPARIRRLVGKAEEACVGVVVVPPGPRSDIREEERQSMIVELERELKETRALVIRMEEPGEKYDQFMEDVHKDGPNKVHVEFHRMYQIIGKIIKEIGETTILHDLETPFMRNQVWGAAICFTCGQEHEPKAECQRFDKCYRCESSTHSEKVCWAVLKMCVFCGVRGHHQSICREKPKSFFRR